MLLGVYRLWGVGHIEARHAETGVLLWRTELGFDSEHWLGSNCIPRGGGLFDAETDRVFWAAASGPAIDRWAIDPFDADGCGPGDPLEHTFVLDADTGSVIASFAPHPGVLPNYELSPMNFSDRWPDGDGGFAPFVDFSAHRILIETGAVVHADRQGGVFVFERDGRTDALELPCSADRGRMPGERMRWRSPPSTHGGTDSTPAAYIRRLGLLYLFHFRDVCDYHDLTYHPGESRPGASVTAVDLSDRDRSPRGNWVTPGGRLPQARVVAKWNAPRVPLDRPEACVQGGCGGFLATDDLVFVTGGGPEGFIAALDARSLEELWRYDTGGGRISAPITAVVGGTQRLAVAVDFDTTRIYSPRSQTETFLLVFDL